MQIKRDEKKFIVYSHQNNRTGEIFYIGIGKRGREVQSYKRSNAWASYVAKYGFLPVVLFSGLTWDQACEKEKELIKKIGRRDKGLGPLVNMTEGGDGAIGQTGYWKGKKRPDLSQRNLGNKYGVGKDGTLIWTPEVREKLSKIHKGKKAWNRGIPGKKWTEEQKLRFSISRLGKSHSEETKNKISNSHKGKKKSASHLLNMSISQKGKKASAETKIKLSNAQKERWKKIKEQIQEF